MEIFVDIADLNAVKQAAAYYPIDGFTTNPKILATSGADVSSLFAAYKPFIRENRYRVFVQVTAENAEDMLAQAVSLADFFGETFVVKLPATKEGYKAIPLCKEKGIAVCLTVVHSSMQAIMAAKAGADYVAPYISHIDNLGFDSIGCVEEMLAAFAAGGYNCKVLGASFRTVNQVKNLAAIGCDAVTVTPDMLDAMIAHPSTDESMMKFKASWYQAFGDKQVDSFIPQ